MGAHDISHINGKLSFNITTGDEKFISLGDKVPSKIDKGEYAFMDEEKILCRFEIKQCEETKIHKNTKSFVLYAQGNKNTDEGYVKGAFMNACNLIRDICGGNYELLEVVNEDDKVNKSQNIEGVVNTMVFPPFKQQEKAKPSIPAVVVKSPVQSSASKAPVHEGIANIVDFAHWEKIDLRVAKIEKVEDIEGADKLYKLSISLGSEKRTLCAGLKKFYTKQELAGKQCIVFANLAPRIMKGITSQGMILAAVSEDESKIILLAPEKEIEEGSRVR